jgi:hypothetical protein
MTERLSLSEKLANESVKVSRVLPEVLLAIRADLELPIDAEEYRALFEEQQKASLQAAKQAIERMRNVIETLRPAILPPPDPST